MFNFKALILITIALILTGCGDPRAADKEELTNVMYSWMPPNYTSDEKEKSVKCVIDILDKELSDDAWTMTMFWARDDRDGYNAWLENNNVNRKAIKGEMGFAIKKAGESCDATDLTIN